MEFRIINTEHIFFKYRHALSNASMAELCVFVHNSNVGAHRDSLCLYVDIFIKVKPMNHKHEQQKFKYYSKMNYCKTSRKIMMTKFQALDLAFLLCGLLFKLLGHELGRRTNVYMSFNCV